MAKQKAQDNPEASIKPKKSLTTKAGFFLRSDAPLIAPKPPAVAFPTPYGPFWNEVADNQESVVIVEAPLASPLPEVKLIDWALEIAGSPEKLGEWVQMPIPALSGRTPYQALQTEQGRIDLERVLGQIEHGIY